MIDSILHRCECLLQSAFSVCYYHKEAGLIDMAKEYGLCYTVQEVRAEYLTLLRS